MKFFEFVDVETTAGFFLLSSVWKANWLFNSLAKSALFTASPKEGAFLKAALALVNEQNACFL